ncbi:MAG: hypothetical protein ACYTBP_15950 [Planctomycetota bacterium]|jgi:hypothetical protein
MDWLFYKITEPHEILYAAAFIAFGVSDLIEATCLPVWLLLAKGAILALILILRKKVIGYYPNLKL